MTENILVIIPARGGSKGIPGKNVKLLNGKPLIYYAIDAARSIVDDSHICVTTDSDAIIQAVESYGLVVPFKRPDELATDTAGTYEVLLHALNYYEAKGEIIDVVVLLQATSPFRTAFHVKEALSLYQETLDMVVSVCPSSSNPYYDSYEDDANGMLQISKGDDSYIRRQDCPPVYDYNGAIYVINPKSLKEKPMGKFTKKKKYVMDREHSVDLDTMMDWMIAEYMIENKIVEI
ncbi:MAG: acylneuraminate cytidylyltransferase family protein [Bacteroidales bacterium]|nr:acylneuraminate cytidylyltransferase family protein [Bacteroidales bacterium]